MVSLLNENITRGHSLKLNKPGCLKSLRQNAFPARCIDRLMIGMPYQNEKLRLCDVTLAGPTCPAPGE